MELKVWVEGIQRIVCGVSEATTCQDVVYALAHATGKTGRFTLIERWRNNERLLAPHEHPLKILTKWGEYSSDVQFILQRSAFDSTKTGGQTTPSRQKPSDSPHTLSSPTASPDSSIHTPERNRDIRKSLTFSGGHHSHILSEVHDNLNVRTQQLEVRDDSPKQGENIRMSPSQHSSSDGNISPFGNSSSKKQREAPPYREPPGPNSPSQGRTLPPYREPPPPTSSPSRNTPPHSSHSPLHDRTDVGSKVKLKKNLLKEFQNTDGSLHQETVLYSAQYRDLIRLINFQREKLTSLQADLTKCDAEIVFWEGKSREQQHQMEFLSQEAAHMETASQHTEEQLRLLSNVEEENEIVRQQEKTLKSEITLLRSKLANCETELLQYKNKIRLLMEELHSEQRTLQRESEDRKNIERSLLGEVERLQREVEQVKQGAEMTAQCGENLKHEVSTLELTIAEKKRQVEHLVAQMKEANLESLAIAPAEEIKHLLEGPHKPGSTRKMIGSPRQLENAVPTSKNPHGVWV